MLLLWLGTYPKPLPVLHFDTTQIEAATVLMLLVMEEDTLTLEDTWQYTIEPQPARD